MSPWRCLALSVCAFLCLWPAAAGAQEPAATPVPLGWSSSKTTLPASDGIGRVAIYFLVLIALAGGGLYVLKNGLPLRARIANADRKLQIRETKMLGGRQFLIVVEYEDSKMLLGVTPGKIDYLCALESRGAPADFHSLVPPDTSAGA